MPTQAPQRGLSEMVKLLLELKLPFLSHKKSIIYWVSMYAEWQSTYFVLQAQNKLEPTPLLLISCPEDFWSFSQENPGRRDLLCVSFSANINTRQPSKLSTIVSSSKKWWFG